MLRWVMFVLLAACVQAGAATIEETLSHCRSLATEKQRLACYEELTRAVEEGVVLPPLPDTDTGKWNVSQEISPIDDSVNVTIILEAEENKNTRGLFAEEKALSVMCKENTTLVGFASTGIMPFGFGFMDDAVTVLSRFDKEKPEEQKWTLASNKKVVIPPFPHIFWARKIIKARKLYLRVYTDEKTVSATFDLTGSANAMEPLRKSCGW